MIKNNYDVIVVGGGIAGVSAALAASRENKKVALFEKNISLGGLATLGLITVFLPLCDGQGNQVTFGIADELIRLSIKMGYQRKYPSAWLENGSFEERKRQRFEVQFNPIYFSLLLEQLLLENNVQIFYESTLVNTEVSNGHVQAITVNTIEGTKTVFAKAIVDATGEAQVFTLANMPTRKYEKKNILAAWYYYVEDNKLKLNMLGTVEKSNYLDENRHADLPLSTKRYYGDKIDDRNQFILDSHKMMLADMIKRSENNKSFEAACIPSYPQLRISRTIFGKNTLQDCPNTPINDSIGVVGDWRRSGYCYEIPFSCMYSEGLNNVFAAGRCISANDEMCEISRVIPTCALTGEAAGIAASIYCEKKNVLVEDVQSRLRKRTQIIHIKDLSNNAK